MTDAALTASVLIWTIAIAAGAGLVFARLARLATWGRAREGEEVLTKKIEKWMAVPIVTIVVSLALWDMSEYWWNKLERQLMWETRWEFGQASTERSRDISAFLTRVLPSHVEEAATALKRNARFKERKQVAASEIVKPILPSKTSTIASKAGLTLEQFQNGWRRIGAEHAATEKRDPAIDDYPVRRLRREIDGDWALAASNTIIYVFLRENRDGQAEVLGTRQHNRELFRRAHNY